MENNDSETWLLTPIEAQIFKLAKPYLQVRSNERHTRSSLVFVTDLLDVYKAERRVVIPAMILHDVGWSRLSKDQIFKAWGPYPDMTLLRLHEEEGVKIALHILGEIGYDPATAMEIIAIIDGHDTRTSPLSLNDEIVKDSDKLTRYGNEFWFIVHQLSIPRDKLVTSLEKVIDQWLFLDFSRRLARAELEQRRTEEERDEASLDDGWP